MASLAVRISRWTTNSLLTCMLLVMALGFGREVLHWWHDDPTPAKSDGSRSLAVSTVSPDSQVLSFGHQKWTIKRQEFRGQAAQTASALQAFCRAAIADAPPGGDSPDATEQNVLKRLAAEKPVAEEPGHWRLYQWSQGFPIMIGTRSLSGTLRVPPANGMRSVPDTKGTNLAETTYRVVIWGIAVPAAPGTWSLYVFQPGSAEQSNEHAASEIPITPGGHRLASIRAEGGSITAFSVDDDLGASTRPFYDRWFADHGWSVATPWQQNSTGWHARFEPFGKSLVAVDIRLSTDPQGHCTGLIMESQDK